MFRRAIGVMFAVGVFAIPMELSAQILVGTSLVNLDLQRSGDITHVGDDGVLSAPGFVFWNGIDGTTPVIPLLDEAAGATSLSYSPGGGADPMPSIIGSVNTLQDSGFNNLGTTTFSVLGFSAQDSIDLAVYLDQDTVIEISHGGGVTRIDNFGSPPSGLLPGVADSDYVILSGLSPRAGTNDLVFGPNGQHDGVVTGVQILVNTIPEPTGVAPFTWCIGYVMVKRRRRASARS